MQQLEEYQLFHLQLLLVRDLDISHEEFIMILNQKDRYEKMKYNLISENGDEKQETIKLNNI